MREKEGKGKGKGEVERDGEGEDKKIIRQFTKRKREYIEETGKETTNENNLKLEVIGGSKHSENKIELDRVRN